METGVGQGSETAEQDSGPKVAEAIVPLTPDECWEFLAGETLGRLAASVAGVPDIFPVNYVPHQRTLLFRTGPGTKLLELTVSRYVAFEVDRWNDSEATSVVVRGMASVVEDHDEVAEADLLALQSWVPTATPVYVRIRPAALSGRRFRLAAQPRVAEPDGQALNTHPELYWP